ncbi:uncharacterized protein N7529_004776 [Penicillium soppii]|uniref:uncharacterized protein n=1 Tax=Penicillium soppii TaxID=69789 RepID=UPI0025485CEF|nr:uncharacterized protein N7529_004776 [Penicillium soppii]KAJ5872423.1 hypothetical protein N7529_004776 [Penicillium soppii]
MSFGAPGGGSVNYKPSPVVASLLIMKVCSFAATWRRSKKVGKTNRNSGLSANLNYAGECKHIISGYLKCIKLNKGTNDEACRKLAKDYLACRMDKNLMAPDNFQNLGLIFKDDEGKDQTSAASAAPAANANQTGNKS